MTKQKPLTAYAMRLNPRPPLTYEALSAPKNHFMLVFCVLLVVKQPFWALGIFIFALLVLGVMFIYFFALAPQ